MLERIYVRMLALARQKAGREQYERRLERIERRETPALMAHDGKPLPSQPLTALWPLRLNHYAAFDLLD